MKAKHLTRSEMYDISKALGLEPPGERKRTSQAASKQADTDLVVPPGPHQHEPRVFINLYRSCGICGDVQTLINWNIGQLTDSQVRSLLDRVEGGRGGSRVAPNMSDGSHHTGVGSFQRPEIALTMSDEEWDSLLDMAEAVLASQEELAPEIPEFEDGESEDAPADSNQW